VDTTSLVPGLIGISLVPLGVPQIPGGLQIPREMASFWDPGAWWPRQIGDGIDKPVGQALGLQTWYMGHSAQKGYIFSPQI